MSTNPNFMTLINAKPADRLDVFLTTAHRLGTPVQHIEKDFWVTWILDLLFNDRHPQEPRLLFKGGTSLSKAHALISRFSEDIDITVFREDLGQNIPPEELAKLSGKQQRHHLAAIKQTCQEYIHTHLKNRLNEHILRNFQDAGISHAKLPIQIDPDDPDQQTLLFYYPSVTMTADTYVYPVVKIEAGAKSALVPHALKTITPYIHSDLKHANLEVHHVVTINAERTFWDKVVILHGLRHWHDQRGVLRQQGYRCSRHYYDIYQLVHSPIKALAIRDYSLALDCARHAQLFFNRADLDLQHAIPGSLCISPSINMLAPLKRDYLAMKGMIFGRVPPFSEVIQTLTKLEQELNLAKHQN
jgi:hypothetical protein